MSNKEECSICEKWFWCGSNHHDITCNDCKNYICYDCSSIQKCKGEDCECSYGGNCSIYCDDCPVVVNLTSTLKDICNHDDLLKKERNYIKRIIKRLN